MTFKIKRGQDAQGACPRSNNMILLFETISLADRDLSKDTDIVLIKIKIRADLLEYTHDIIHNVIDLTERHTPTQALTDQTLVPGSRHLQIVRIIAPKKPFIIWLAFIECFLQSLVDDHANKNICSYTFGHNSTSLSLDLCTMLH